MSAEHIGELAAYSVTIERHGVRAGANVNEGRVLGVGVMVQLNGCDYDLTADQLYERVRGVLRAHIAEIATIKELR